MRPLHRVAGTITMPDDGVGSVQRLMASARHRLLVKMFTFDDSLLVEAVIEAKRRGVDTQVLLNPAKVNGLRLNDRTFEVFKAAGVVVDWTNPAFAVTHEKSIVVDDTVALVATFNFSAKYFTRTRDFGILLDDERSLAEIVACFDADRAREPFRPVFDAGNGSPMIWSEANSRRVSALVVDRARRSLLIQHPKFNDAAMLDRVTAACERGVKVKYLCGGHHGIEDWDLTSNLSNQRILARAGVRVRRQHHLRCHAKLIVADEKLALVGSMNIDAQAYDRRRELGVLFDDRDAIDSLLKTFKRDWAEATRYEPSDPLNGQSRAGLIQTVDACGMDPALAHD